MEITVTLESPYDFLSHASGAKFVAFQGSVAEGVYEEAYLQFSRDNLTFTTPIKVTVIESEQEKQQTELENEAEEV